MNGQQPFECNGRIFRVLEEQAGSTFQELFIDEASQRIDIIDLRFYEQLKVNGIAYHPTQNVIYGILLGKTYRLCRIDANYELEIIRELPLPESVLFVSGDVSPDERYLVLLGYSPDEAANLIALVDLTDPAFPTQVMQVGTTAPDRLPVYCADIAFHPTTDQLFGFDHLSGRLVTIDLRRRIIDNTTFPATTVLQGNVPSIFFDAQGELYGIGAANAGYAANRNFYHFDVQTGAVSFYDKLSFEGNQDACSCPFKVKLLNRVSTRRAAPCTEISFTLTLINRSDQVQTDLRLTDTFPSYINIVEVGPLPFPATITAGSGNNVLDIRDIDLPIGLDSFQITVEINRNAPDATIYNTAYLDGVDLLEAGPVRIRSDDPETPAPNDATWFAVAPLRAGFDAKEVYLCKDSNVRLSPSLPEGISYQWSTGEQTPAIEVSSPGLYSVMLTTVCEQIRGEVLVKESVLELELGPDRILERGQVFLMQPEIRSNSDIRSYYWRSDEDQPMICATCAELEVRPCAPADYFLQVMNADGCFARDSIRLEVMDFRLFAPNAFSPNNDGINDVFYLQSRSGYALKSFRIFDRWGSLIFQASEGSTNERERGWDGTHSGRLLNNGVYVWFAELTDLSGALIQTNGEVSLIR